MMLVNISILCLVLPHFGHVVASIIFPTDDSDYRSSVGDSCRRSNGSSGICTMASNCSTFEKSTSDRADICSITSPNEIIVCCPVTIEKIISKELRKSEQKCDEFKGLVDMIQSRQLSFITVAGGYDTEPDEFPHMAALGWTESNSTVNWACGGTLISEDFVLTAAHCIKPSSLPDVVRIGDKNLKTTNDNASPEEFGITQFIVHPEYKTISVYNDIALVRLNRKIGLHNKIRPACLWSKDNIDFTRATATGWGRVAYDGDQSYELQKVEVNIFNNDVCERIYPPYHRIKEGIISSQLCAGDLAGGKDTCQGDSGGPLQVSYPYLFKNFYYVIGITSFGKPCAAPDTASVYTRVSKYLDWIESVVWP